MQYKTDRFSVGFEIPKIQKGFFSINLLELNIFYDDDDFGICKHKETTGISAGFLGFTVYMFLYFGEEVKNEKETN